MHSVFSSKRFRELSHKIQLCDSFIAKEIDVEYYKKEKEKAQKELDEISKEKKVSKKFISIGIFIALFIALFFLVLYILKQLI